MSHKALAWVAALGVLAIAIIGGLWFVINQGKGDTPSWLFSHTATSGTFEANADGTYVLMLAGIDPHVIAFTDRPYRDSAIVSASDLVRDWADLFAAAAPNAVLIEHSPTGQDDSVVITVSNPQLDGTTLRFDAELIADEASPNLQRLAGKIHASPPTTFARASLFIDDVNDWWPANNATFICEYPESGGVGRDPVKQSFSLPDQQPAVDEFRQDCADQLGFFSQVR